MLTEDAIYSDLMAMYTAVVCKWPALVSQENGNSDHLLSVCVCVWGGGGILFLSIYCSYCKSDGALQLRLHQSKSWTIWWRRYWRRQTQTVFAFARPGKKIHWFDKSTASEKRAAIAFLCSLYRHSIGFPQCVTSRHIICSSVTESQWLRVRRRWKVGRVSSAID